MQLHQRRTPQFDTEVTCVNETMLHRACHGVKFVGERTTLKKCHRSGLCDYFKILVPHFCEEIGNK